MSFSFFAFAFIFIFHKNLIVLPSLFSSFSSTSYAFKKKAFIQQQKNSRLTLLEYQQQKAGATT